MRAPWRERLLRAPARVGAALRWLVSPNTLRRVLSDAASVVPQDTTFEFERRRNRPERYDRNLVGTTLKVRALSDNAAGLHLHHGGRLTCRASAVYRR